MDIIIVFEPAFYKKAERILLRHSRSPNIEKVVRTLPGVRWSQSNHVWHIPLNEAACKIALEKGGACCYCKPIGRLVEAGQHGDLASLCTNQKNLERRPINTPLL